MAELEILSIIIIIITIIIMLDFLQMLDKQKFCSITKKSPFILNFSSQLPA